MAGQKVEYPQPGDEVRNPHRTWRDAQSVAAWNRWHDKMVVHQVQLTRALISEAMPFSGANVLDLGSGVGDPAMGLARRVGLSGTVVAADSSPEMVAALQVKLAVAGVENAEAYVADACDLPFPDRTFDIVTSKLGAAYFSPLPVALAEIKRVLRHGGRFAMVSWGMPEVGDYFNACVLPFIQRSQLPPPAPDEPTPVRFSPPGSAAKALVAAGFDSVREIREVVEMKWPGPPDELFRQLHDTAVTIRPYFDDLLPDEYVRAHADAMQSLAKLYDGRTTNTRVEIVIASGSA